MMAARSLRDEMMRGSTARGVRRRRRPPIAAIVVGMIILLVIVVALLSQVRTQAEADTQPVPGAESEIGEGAVSPTPQAGAGHESEAPAPEGVDGRTSDLQGAAGDLRRTLDALQVVPGSTSADYDRDLFGQAWYDYDRNGCDTRNDVLRRDLSEIVLKEGTNGCKVLSGRLDDLYSGRTVVFVSGGETSRLVQIDHVVPLAWAWRHGSDAWPDEKRLEFANDPLNLIATTDVENGSKSDSGPSEWLPTSEKGTCRYVQRFTQVLERYALGIDLRDRAMIRGVLDECAASDAFGGFDPLP